MICSVPRPMDETGALSNRTKYRAVRNLPNEQCDNISDRAAEKAERDYEDLKSRGEI